MNSLQPIVPADLEQPRKLPKNECGFTPAAAEVNIFFYNSILPVFNRVQPVHRGMPNFCAALKTKISQVSLRPLISRIPPIQGPCSLWWRPLVEL